MLYISKKIFEKDGKICQRPIRELEEKKHLVSDVKGMLAGEGYPVYEMTISDITKNRFKVILSEKLILDYADGKFRMHFTDQDKTSVSSGRSMRYVEVEEVENLKILADTSSVEVFVNDGNMYFRQDIIRKFINYRQKLWEHRLRCQKLCNEISI